MRPTTSLLLTLFGKNQPISEARTVTCDLLLELVEAQLDEGLSYLEKDGPRLARKQVKATREFGSVKAMVEQVMRQMPDANEPIKA